MPVARHLSNTRDKAVGLKASHAFSPWLVVVDDCSRRQFAPLLAARIVALCPDPNPERLFCRRLSLFSLLLALCSSRHALLVGSKLGYPSRRLERLTAARLNPEGGEGPLNETSRCCSDPKSEHTGAKLGPSRLKLVG